MASKYQEQERYKQTRHIQTSNIFEGTKGSGMFMGKNRDFVLQDGLTNLYAPIRKDVENYFKENKISWWQGSKPTGHLLSSQITCLNHLFHIRDNKAAVLKVLNGVRNEFVDVLPIVCGNENTRGYIGFEVISKCDRLNEKSLTRGSQCTSIDAFIYALHKSGAKWLIPIEWKYTEHYPDQDKSIEDIKGKENKGLNGKGNERLSRYTDLINNSGQLKSLRNYRSSIYYQEPFYQLMRQTLWAENVIEHQTQEDLKASDYLHIHVIPKNNGDLLHKKYKVSGSSMEDSWRCCLSDQSKYIIADPAQLLFPIANDYHELCEYLAARYW